MKHAVLFYIAAAMVVVGVILAVYFLIPGIYHPYIALRDNQIILVDPIKHPSIVKSAHRFYAAASFGLAVIFAFATYLFRPKKRARAA